MDVSGKPREKWGSKLGFILAAAGSAVGLGNIWRFPYLTGENGGGAFVFVYLLCVLLIGIPLLLNEVALGRHTKRNPIGAIQSTIPNSIWLVGPILCIAVCFFVLSYYSVIAGWAIGFLYTNISGSSITFETIQETPKYILPLLGIFILMTIWIVQGGVSKGIEKASKILMPLLLLIVVAVAIKSLSLPGAMAGVDYYLNPDFSKINGKVVIMALGQAFFSLSVGWGLMITYGSYMDKSHNIVSAGVWVAFTDTLVALLGGLMIFPAIFALTAPAEIEGVLTGGTTLVFNVLPQIFDQMPGGAMFGAIFFILLVIAALTSSISMLEVPVSYMIDEKKWNRKKSAWVIGGFAFLLGIPSALSFGAVDGLSAFKIFGTEYNFLGMMDTVFGTFSVIIISLSLSLFTGWAFKTDRLVAEINEGSSFSKPIALGISMAQVWVFFIKFVVPIVVGVMLLTQFGIINI
ncbi:MAG: sodium-dependent transporter [Bacteroidetes bacterium]|nr:sodium-dependent transporter [Bacteroidota bacterium]